MIDTINNKIEDEINNKMLQLVDATIHGGIHARLNRNKLKGRRKEPFPSMNLYQRVSGECFRLQQAIFYTVTVADPLKFDETSQSIYSPEKCVRVPPPTPRQHEGLCLDLWPWSMSREGGFNSSCVLGLIPSAPSGYWMSTGILCPKPYLLLWIKGSTK